MVVFADPQMEGDAKIRRLGKRALVDLAFNDAYMRHIYKTMMSPSWAPLNTLSSYLSQEEHKATAPTHVTILGDLFSSQWIKDSEFDIRLERYKSIFSDPAQQSPQAHQPRGAFDDPRNVPIMINITGNHDIGYGYDISQSRLDRWETAFGKSNFITSVRVPHPTSGRGSGPGNFNISETLSQQLHLVVLNTMLLDGPSSDENLRGQTWEFLQEAALIKEQRPSDKIVLLTHIPFHKEKDICVDPPDIRFHSDQTIIEQTMLTPNTTNWILDYLKPDFILNGHDHFGCDVTHVQELNEHGDEVVWKAYATASPSLDAVPEKQGDRRAWVREVTQRSMMAEYAGYSGLFEIRRTSQSSEPELEFHYRACGFFTDLQVWAMIVTDLIVAGVWCVIALCHVVRNLVVSRSQKSRIPSFSTKEKQN
ncbi:hypothetical protein BG011_008749 [Mortierella polycephala]|uniref:Calcineurin-like phosphoesterase domain-containing protein n=1 Tax=Mortierella polycephala TaxID=41804 RepID=A0A9P6U756_9FUNG|nr:hypothetical protein BG011_008749 [Mortierella polycephala]